MPEQVWALVGVVVGALLGGVAQIVANHLTDRRRVAEWRRDKSAEVYAAFSAEWASIRPRVILQLETAEGVSGGGYGEPITPAELNARLQERRSEIALYGAREVHRLSRWPVQRLTEALRAEDPQRAGDLLHQALDDFEAFRTAARKELGVE